MPKLPRLSLHFFALLTIFVLAVFNLRSYLGPSRVLGANSTASTEKDYLLDEEKFWQDFLAVNPGYLPGWIELAKTEFELGNTAGAKIALRQAKAISPNIEVGKLAPELVQLGKI